MTATRAPREAVGFGLRAGARVIDLLVHQIFALMAGVGAAVVLTMLELSGLVSPGWANRLDGGVVLHLGMGLSATLVGNAAMTWVGGLSLGKLLLRLRVVMESGARPTLGASFIRELLYYVDALFFGLVAKARMDKDPMRQRYGDAVAHTVVVRQTWSELSADGLRIVGGIILGSFLTIAFETATLVALAK